MTYFSASSVLRSARGFAAAAGLGLTTVAAGMLIPVGTASANVTPLPLPLSGLTPTGDASSQPSNNPNGPSAGVTVPGGGTSQFLLTTESVSGDGTTVSGTSAVPVGALANAMYLDPAQVAYNSGNAGTEGSALAFTFNAQAGYGFVEFNYNFVTAENVGAGANPDFALYSLTPVDANGFATGPATTGLLASANDPVGGFSTLNDPNLNSPFNLTEGYKTAFVGGLTPGTYVLALGVADADTTDTQSGLFVANVVQVPEPGVTTLLVLAGGAGVCWAWRRRNAARVGV